MVAEIGILIAAYVITRMVDMMVTHSDGRVAAQVLVRIFGSGTILLAVVIGLDLLTRGMEVSESTPYGPWGRPGPADTLQIVAEDLKAYLILWVALTRYGWRGYNSSSRVRGTACGNGPGAVKGCHRTTKSVCGEVRRSHLSTFGVAAIRRRKAQNAGEGLRDQDRVKPPDRPAADMIAVRT